MTSIPDMLVAGHGMHIIEHHKLGVGACQPFKDYKVAPDAHPSEFAHKSPFT